jgi:hypothetical protein
MTNVPFIRGINFGCRIAIVLMGSVAPLLAADAPVRLGIRVDPTTINVGGIATITVEFLNKDFRPLSNDRARIVRLQTKSTGERTEGKGHFDPPTVRITKGSASYSQIRLTATAAGTLRVWAESDGLEPGEALVQVRSTTASLWRLLAPVVEAQSPTAPFRLLPLHREVPLSPAPAVSFWIAVDRPVAKKRQWRITPDRPVPIRFDGVVTEGFSVVEVDAGEWTSHPIIFEPSDLVSIGVVAKLLPEGPEVQANVNVVPQEAKSFLLELDHRVPASVTSLPLTINLLGEASAPLRTLRTACDIELTSMTAGWKLPPQRVRFSESKVSQILTVPLPSVRFGTALDLLARDVSGSNLGRVEKQVQVLAARSALILLAMAAGMLGGLARLVYRERQVDFLPHRVNGHLQRGIALDACFSGLFGILLLLLGDMGLLHQFADQLERDEIRVAFLLGIAGGFSGIVVLQSLSKWTVGAVSRSLPSNSQTIGTQ